MEWELIFWQALTDWPIPQKIVLYLLGSPYFVLKRVLTSWDDQCTQCTSKEPKREWEIGY